MKSGLKSIMLMGLAMAAIAETGTSGTTRNEDVINRRPPKKIIPKGCKEYFFTGMGYCFTERPAHREIAFECVATSEKSAQKKFDKWKANQSKS